MTRKLLWPILFVGIALVVAPFAMGLPGKAAGGQRMMNGFQPIMQPDQVKKTADYYYNVFTPLRPVSQALNAATIARFNGYVKGFAGMQADAEKLVPLLAQTMHVSPVQIQLMMKRQLPALALMLQSLPAMEKDFTDLLGMMKANAGIFAQVPAGLDHYKPLVTTMQANVDNYQKVNSLPDFRLFTVFFVVPGLLLVLLSGYGLLFAEGRHFPIHWHRPAATH